MGVQMRETPLRHSIAFAVAASMGFAPSHSLAQPSIVEGDRVRVTTDAGATHLGTVGSLSADRIELRDGDGGAIFSGSLDSLRRVEVSRGQRNYVGVGLAGGAALGLASGFVICSMGEVCSLLSTNDIRPQVLVISGAVGLLVGWLVGSQVTGDQWAEIDTDRLGVTVSSSARGSLSIGIALAR